MWRFWILIMVAAMNVGMALFVTHSPVVKATNLFAAVVFVAAAFASRSSNPRVRRWATWPGE